MKELLFVFIGGGCGSVLRFSASMLWKHLSLHPNFSGVLFPWPTFVVNVLGCLLISLGYQCARKYDMAPETVLMLTTGFCGGFTTFSTFSMEGVALINNGHITTYILYLVLSIVLGLIAAFVPVWVAKGSF